MNLEMDSLTLLLYVPVSRYVSLKGKLWLEVENIEKLGLTSQLHLFTLLSLIFKLLASIPSFLPPLRTARCSPSPRASMKVRRRLLIIANYRNTGRPWWDQPVALQAGAKAKAGGGKEFQLKTAFKRCVMIDFFFFLVNVILMQQVARAAEQT